MNKSGFIFSQTTPNLSCKWQNIYCCSYKSLWYNDVFLFAFKQPLTVITQNNMTDINLLLNNFYTNFRFFIKWIQLLYNCPQNLAIVCFHKT